MFHSGRRILFDSGRDSEGEEGKFFVWSEAEVMAILGEDAGAIFCRIYGGEVR
jgi:uncharacterized protein YyaL (SSP411 family)